MTRLGKIRKAVESMGFKRGRNDGSYVVYYYRYEDIVEALCTLHEFKGRMDYADVPYKFKWHDSEVIVRF